MRYSVTIAERHYREVEAHLASKPNIEQASFLICRMSKTEGELRLLVHEVLPVRDEDILEQSSTHMKIAPSSYVRAMKRANDVKACLVFVHSHPDGVPRHSRQDDIEEAKLFQTAYVRIRTPGVHGSLVFTRSGVSSGRVWLPDGTNAGLERIRIVGTGYRFWFPDAAETDFLEFFDRQVRAFGRDIQRLLARLRVGVIGVGGTGSCVVEQLVRLGVGTIVIADGEKFESSNVNRVYGSRVIDATIAKVEIAERLAADVGLGTIVKGIPQPISYESVLRQFRECDVLFGCTDDELGRSLLTRLAIYYLLPVFDMGVKVDAEDGIIQSIQGRVTTLMPGAACLNCRGRLRPDRMRAESIRAHNPEEALELEQEGYIDQLADPAPAVVPFTTAIASSAVAEFLHRLTGCLGADRESTEVLHLIDDTKLRTNRVDPSPHCYCGKFQYWGRGDVKPFLDTTWPPE